MKIRIIKSFFTWKKFFFMPWRRVKTNSNHLYVNDTFSVYRTELVLFKCKSQSLKGTDDSKFIFFSLYLHNKLYIRGSKVSSSQPRHKVQKKRIWSSFSFFLLNITLKCVQFKYRLRKVLLPKTTLTPEIFLTFTNFLSFTHQTTLFLYR